MLLAVLSLLTGMVLGQRFKALSLLPAIAVLGIVSISSGMARSEPHSTMLLTTIATIVSVQIGYLLGLGIRHLLALVRANRLRAVAFANSAPARRPAH